MFLSVLSNWAKEEAAAVPASRLSHPGDFVIPAETPAWKEVLPHRGWLAGVISQNKSHQTKFLAALGWGNVCWVSKHCAHMGPPNRYGAGRSFSFTISSGEKMNEVWKCFWRKNKQNQNQSNKKKPHAVCVALATSEWSFAFTIFQGSLAPT